MKSAQQKIDKDFKPVALIIESEDEIYKLYSIYNHAHLSNTMGMGEAYKFLQEFTPRTSLKSTDHSALRKVVKNAH